MAGSLPEHEQLTYVRADTADEGDVERLLDIAVESLGRMRAVWRSRRRGEKLEMKVLARARHNH